MDDDKGKGERCESSEELHLVGRGVGMSLNLKVGDALEGHGAREGRRLGPSACALASFCRGRGKFNMI